MNLKQALLEEHSKSQCNRIVDYIGNNKERFAGLMKIFFGNEYRLTQRAAWPMSYCVRKYPQLILPYFKKLVNKLRKQNEHQAVLRNTLRLLQDVEIPARFHGQLMTTCFEFVQANEKAVAIKAFALTILQNFSRQYPEIIPEIKTIIEERWEHETAAFRSRAKNFLKQVG